MGAERESLKSPLRGSPLLVLITERTPQTPGDYQLEVYFNRQLVRSMTFTITQ